VISKVGELVLRNLPSVVPEVLIKERNLFYFYLSGATFGGVPENRSLVVFDIHESVHLLQTRGGIQKMGGEFILLPPGLRSFNSIG